MSVFRIFALLLVVSLFILSGVTLLDRASAPKEEKESTAETESKAMPTVYLKASYVADGEKNAWREPLVTVLSSLDHRWHPAVRDDVFTDDEGTCVSGGAAISLFDLTGDGVPEVLEFYAEGNSGYVGVRVYDLYTGKDLGYLSSGEYGLEDSMGYFRSCYDRETGKIYTLLTYFRESGCDYYDQYTVLIGSDGEGAVNVIEKYRASAFLPYAYSGSSGDDAMILIRYYRNEEAISAPEYMYGLEAFTRRYEAFPETVPKVIYWFDIEGETQSVRAERMADRLLAEEQWFLIP